MDIKRKDKSKGAHLFRRKRGEGGVFEIPTVAAAGSARDVLSAGAGSMRPRTDGDVYLLEKAVTDEADARTVSVDEDNVYSEVIYQSGKLRTYPKRAPVRGRDSTEDSEIGEYCDDDPYFTPNSHSGGHRRAVHIAGDDSPLQNALADLPDVCAETLGVNCDRDSGVTVASTEKDGNRMNSRIHVENQDQGQLRSYYNIGSATEGGLRRVMKRTTSDGENKRQGSSGYASPPDTDTDDFDDFSSDDFDSDSAEGEETAAPQSNDEWRLQIVKELLATEEAYVKKLFLLQQFGWELNAIQSTLGKKKSTCPDDGVRLPMIDSIHKLHSEHLLPNLRHLLDTWSPSSRLSAAFVVGGGGGRVPLTPHFLLYLNYVSDLNSNSDVIRRLKRLSPEIGSFVAEKEKSPAFGKLSIEMYMMEPFQRLPRYEIVLKRYLNYVDDAEEEVRIKGILGDLESCCCKIQALMKQKDADAKMLQLQDLIPDFMVVDGNREFVKEGDVTLIKPIHDRQRKCHLFLFSDVLLMTTSGGVRGKHHVIQHVTLSDARVRPASPAVSGPRLDAACCLVLRHGRKHNVLMAFSSAAERADWQAALGLTTAVAARWAQVRDQHLVLAQSPQDMSEFHEAPVFQPDSASENCMRCAREFTVVRRRHHCRACGELVCGSCSPYKVRMPYKDYSLERVCNRCFLKVYDERKELLENARLFTDLPPHVVEGPDTDC